MDLAQEAEITAPGMAIPRPPHCVATTMEVATSTVDAAMAMVRATLEEAEQAVGMMVA
jgi:hypothetical protein